MYERAAGPASKRSYQVTSILSDRNNSYLPMNKHEEDCFLGRFDPETDLCPEGFLQEDPSFRCLDEHYAFLNAALPKAVLDLGSDIDEPPARGNIEPEFFAIAFHFVRDRAVIRFLPELHGFHGFESD
jgi:hypothetical protein